MEGLGYSCSFQLLFVMCKAVFRLSLGQAQSPSGSAFLPSEFGNDVYIPQFLNELHIHFSLYIAP
jgi:hypothetical protein